MTGESEAGQALFLKFPGGVRMELGSTLSVTFPKPGKPVVKPATILDDLRRRDFTANAMAISLNEGSYGLLMDPLNGVADIENRELRLVSNYGFIEDPIRMVRAARLMARLGWTLDEKTQTRYENGVAEGYISALSEYQRGYETEEIIHEEDPLRVLKRLEAEGWMKHLASYWTSAKVNTAELERLRDVQTQLQVQGIQPEAAAANFPLLTAKLSAKEVAELKKGFPRQGFVAEIDSLEGEAKDFAALLGGKGAAAASDAWKLITSAKPEAVLWTAYTTKSAPLQAKLKSFSTEWPQARTKIPYTTLQEMRITPELPGYDDLLEQLFFALMDGKLGTTEEMKAFLEPFSPPAPPPPVNTRRPRAAKKEAKSAKGRLKKLVKADEDDEELDPEVADEIEAVLPADEDEDALEAVPDADDADDEDEDEAEEVPAPKASKPATTRSAAPVKGTSQTESAPVAPKVTAVKAAAVKAMAPVKAVAAKKGVAKAAPAKAVPAVAKKTPPAVAKKASIPAKKAVAAKKATPAPQKKAAKSVAAKKGTKRR